LSATTWAFKIALIKITDPTPNTKNDSSLGSFQWNYLSIVITKWTTVGGKVLYKTG